MRKKYKISPFGSFKNPDEEARFRASTIREYCLPTICGIVIMMIPLFLFIRSDLIIYGLTSEFYSLLAMRALFFLCSILAIWKLLTTKSVLVFDAIVTFYMALVIAFIAYIKVSRPNAFSGDAVVDVLVILSFYTVFLTRLRSQVAAALALTSFSFLNASNYDGGKQELIFNAIVVASLLANCLGIFLSVRSSIWRRIHYKSSINEKKMVNQLESINEYKSTMLNIISHDLKSPFNALMNFSKALSTKADRLSQDRVKKYSTLIYESSCETYNLLENLLSWSLAQSDKLIYRPDNHSVISVINSNITIANGVAGLKNISIDVECDDSIVAYFDLNMINTVVRNLLSNAIKFSHPSSTIGISVESKDDRVVVKVADSGSGFSEEALDSVFTEQGAILTVGTHDERGTGLGLPLCKDFIHRNGGDIWAVNNIDSGSTISFSLIKKT